jgi:hypothetical protein
LSRNVAVVPNQWTHIVCIWNREALKPEIYQDGLVKSTTTSIAILADLAYKDIQAFTVGTHLINKPMKGLMREFIVFDRPLTINEVNFVKGNLFNSEKYPKTYGNILHEESPGLY